MGVFFTDHNGNFCTSERCQKQLQIVKSNLFLSMNSKQQCKPLQTCLKNVLEKAISRGERGFASPSSTNIYLSEGFANKGAKYSLCRAWTYLHGNGVTLQQISPKREQRKGVFQALSKSAPDSLLQAQCCWWTKVQSCHLGSRLTSCSLLPATLTHLGQVGRRLGVWKEEK